MLSFPFPLAGFFRLAPNLFLAAAGAAVCLISAFGTFGSLGGFPRFQLFVGEFALMTFSTGVGFFFTGSALALFAFRKGKASAACVLLATLFSGLSLYESFWLSESASPSGWLFRGNPDITVSVSLVLSAMATIMLCPGAGRRCLGCPDPLGDEDPARSDLSGKPYPPNGSVCDLFAVFLASIVLAFGALALVGHLAGISTTFSWQQSEIALPAACAASLVGASILAYLWGASRSLPLWLAVPFGIAFIAITLSLVHAIQRHEDSRFRQNIKIETRFLAAQIDLHLSDLFLSLDRMAERWSAVDNFPERASKRDAAAELKAYPFVTAIEWVGADLTPRWIVSETKGADSSDVAPIAEAERAAAFAIALDSQAPQTTRVVPLQGGGVGFLRITPLRLNGRLSGMIVCSVNPKLLLEHITTLHVVQNHGITLRDEQETLFTTLPPHSAYNQSLLDAWSYTIKLSLPGRDWSLIVSPSPKALAERNSLLPLFVLAAGLALSLAAAFLIFFALKWRAASSMLRERGDRLRSIMNNTVEGIITINERGIIESFNPACESMFGLPALDAVGKNVSVLMPEPHASQHDNYLKRYLATGEAHIIGIGREVQGLRKDGSVFPMDLSVNRFVSHGKVMFCGIVRDVSQRKHLQRLQEEFTAIASHELRTPLTCIRGAIGLLSASPPKGIQEREIGLLNIALRNVERLTGIVNDILDTEKIKSGKLPLKLEPVDVRTFLDQALEDNRPISESFNIPFVIVGDVPNVKVLADRDRMLQIFSNLLSNAAKFSREGSEARISVEPLDDSVKFVVRDFGIGIPEDFRPHIFGKFAQSSNTGARGIQGSGLGLLITKALVENMGGTLGYSSEPGKGTTFVFRLPRADAATKDSTSP